MLAATNTKAFILLRDGRIAHERYFDGFGPDSLWRWNSAGKALTAALIGIAQGEGLLDVDDAASAYLGRGWTALAPDREGEIALVHQLTMTTGLDDDVADVYCTAPACLTYRASPGTRWAYHNAPYTQLLAVLEAASGVSANRYAAERLTPVTGIQGAYVQTGYNRGFVSRARDLARFGLLLLGDGVWGGTPVLADAEYLRQMRSPSQPLNPAYGYLWWLSGSPSYRLPGSQRSVQGAIAPAAPADLYAGIGKNGQIVSVIPSRGEVWIRTGERPPDDAGGFVPTAYIDQLSAALEAAQCVSPVATAQAPHPSPLRVWTDGGLLRVASEVDLADLRVVTASGATVAEVRRAGTAYAVPLPAGASGVLFVVGRTPAGALAHARVAVP